MRRRLTGSAVGVLASLALTAMMVPFRTSLDSATAALVLVVPVLVGVVLGGFVGGLVSVAAGFLAYDWFFIRPYGTLSVGRAQNWVALGVYVIVMVLVARVVAVLDEARSASARRAYNARHLVDLSELLLMDKPADELGRAVTGWAHGSLGVDGAALLLSNGNELEVTASSGTAFSPEELRRLRPGSRLPVPLSTSMSHDTVQTLALASSGRPVGLLVLRNVPPEPVVRETLPIVANHLAIALERAQLRERLLQAELLEEVDNLRRSLIGAVSHDLRTPLATIKVASSTFLDKAGELSAEDADELHSLIDMQADRLTRLVNSLLDMTRIQSGALEVRRKPQPVRELLDEALTVLRSALGARRVVVDISGGGPLIDVDAVLIVHVLTNLIENADRFAPAGTPITISVSAVPGGRAAVRVIDHGKGVPPAEREAIFEKFVRFDTGGRSGLGLAIAKAFVEAHGERIWVEGAPGGGACFVFTVPLAATKEAVPVTGEPLPVTAEPLPAAEEPLPAAEETAI